MPKPLRKVQSHSLIIKVCVFLKEKLDCALCKNNKAILIN